MKTWKIWLLYPNNIIPHKKQCSKCVCVCFHFLFYPHSKNFWKNVTRKHSSCYFDIKSSPSNSTTCWLLLHWYNKHNKHIISFSLLPQISISRRPLFRPRIRLFQSTCTRRNITRQSETWILSTTIIIIIKQSKCHRFSIVIIRQCQDSLHWINSRSQQ